MPQIARLVRWWFGFEVFLMIPACVAEIIARARYQDSHHFLMFTAIFGSIAIGMAAVYVTAWWTLRKGKPSARAWAIAASVLNLPVLGLGTIAGIVGLVVFSRRDVVAQTASHPETPRLPGDGTSKTIDNVSIVLQVICLIVAMHWWYRWARSQGLPQESQSAWWLQFFIALHLSIVFHEMGHVVAGWACRMRLRRLVIGPLFAMVRSGKWQIRFEVAGLLGRGATAMVPVDLADLRRRQVILSIAGPIGSLVCGVFGIAAVLTAKGNFWASWWDCLSMMATFGFLHFIFNLMPLRPDSQYSDGARVYQILTGGPWADVEMAFAMVAAELVTPVRPRDLDADVLRRACNFIPHGERGFMLRMFLCLHHLDRGETDDALEAFASAELLYSQVAKQLGAELLPEMTFIAALYGHDLDGARRYWQQLDGSKPAERSVDYWKGKTALSLLEGNIDHAREACDNGRRLAAELPRCGAYDFDRWCFEQLEEAVNAAAVPVA